MSQAERQINIGGAGVQPFWAAYTTSPEPQPLPATAEGTVTQYGLGEDDGYADLLCSESLLDTTPFVVFDTSLRVAGASVPIVSLNHSFNWFSCFSVRFSVDFVTHDSHAILRMTSLSGTSNSLELTISPSKSTLVFDGATIDVTGVILSNLASLSDGYTILAVDAAEFHVIARRKLSHSTGAKAPFDIRCGFYKAGATTEVYRTLRTLKVTEMFNSSFVCHIG